MVLQRVIGLFETDSEFLEKPELEENFTVNGTGMLLPPLLLLTPTGVLQELKNYTVETGTWYHQCSRV